MIFGRLILGDFGILMSNMSQVQTILSFQRIAFGPGWPPKGPVLAKNAPFGDLGGHGRAPEGQIWSQLPPIGLPGLD